MGSLELLEGIGERSFLSALQTYQFVYKMATTTWALKHVVLLIDRNKFSRCTVKENKGLYYRNTTQSVKQQLSENAYPGL